MLRVGKKLFATLIATLFLTASLIAPAIATDTGSVTAELKSSGKGGVAVNDKCPPGSLIREVSASALVWESNNVLTQVSGDCAQISDDGESLQRTTFTTDIRGLADGGIDSTIKCPNGKAASGVIVFNTPGTNYVSGIRLKCSGLPFADAPNTTETIGTQTSLREELICPDNSFVVGLLMRYGWIIDSFGVRCATIKNVDQAPLTSVFLSSDSKVYPYESSIKVLGVNGGTGQGAVSITSVVNGTSSGCSLSGGTLTARTSGTCLLVVTKAGNDLYAPASKRVPFTFTKAQQTISISSLGESSESQSLTHVLSAVIAGAKGKGEVRFEVKDGSATGCKLSDNTAKAELTAVSSGTCLISAKISSDENYEAALASPIPFTFLELVAPTPTPTPTPTPLPTTKPGPTPYDPSSEPDKTVDIQVAAFALLSVAAAGATSLTSSSSRDSSEGRRREDENQNGDDQSNEQRQSGDIASADSGKLTFSKRSTALGDVYGFWRLSHTPAVETRFVTWVEKISRHSPLASRILIDGSYLRAMFSLLALVPTLGGLVLGALMLKLTELQPVPAPNTYFIAAIALGVFDALAGVTLSSVLFLGTLLSGNITTLDQFMTILGLSALIMTPGLIASSIRPLRRAVNSFDDFWERITDYLLMILLGGWAVEKLVGALNGLAGVELAITSEAHRIGLITSLFIFLRLILEDLATHFFPERLAKQEAEMQAPRLAQAWYSLFIKTLIFILVSYQFLGANHQLFWGTVVFLIPSIVTNFGNRVSYKKSSIARVLLPRGAPKIVIMVFIGGFFANWVKSLFADPKIFISWSFVLLAIPGLFFGLLKIFAAPAEKDWKSRKFGKLVYRLGGIAIAALIFAIYRGVDLYALVTGK